MYFTCPIFVLIFTQPVSWPVEFVSDGVLLLYVCVFVCAIPLWRQQNTYYSIYSDILKVDFLRGQNFSFEILHKKKCKNIPKNHLIYVKHEEKTLKQVKMHTFLVCACKSQDFAQIHNHTTMRPWLFKTLWFQPVWLANLDHLCEEKLLTTNTFFW